MSRSKYGTSPKVGTVSPTLFWPGRASTCGRCSEGVATADVAGIGVRVADDDVSRWVQRVLAIANEPFANAATLHAHPLSVGEGEVVVLLEERPVRGERRAERRPLVLLSAFSIVRLGPTAALQASIVFPEVLDVVALRSPNMF